MKRAYTLDAVKDVLFDDIKKRTGGVSLRSLLSKRGINPAFEDDRSKVWKCVSALVSLQRDGSVVSDIQDGTRFYYPQCA